MTDISNQQVADTITKLFSTEIKVIADNMVTRNDLKVLQSGGNN